MINPLRGLANPREVLSWGAYDLANQSFQLLINTLLFSLFVQQVVIESDPDQGQRIWSYMVAASLALVVLLSPVLGAMADQRAWKREMLIATGLVCSTLTMSLALLQPGFITLAFVLYVIAALACGLGENFLGSMLPEISTPATVGRISAIGWTMSYIGALGLLGITALYTQVFDRQQPDQMRPMFVLAGLWFLMFMLPTIFFVRERTAPRPGSGAPVAAAFAQLARSARESARFAVLARFLAIFFVYSMGTKTVIYFMGIIGAGMGFGLRELIVFALEIALTAGIASAVVARVQDRFGHVRTIAVFLIIWTISTLTLAIVRQNSPDPWVFWAISAGIGIGLGGIGTASRAAVGLFTPVQRAGEFFGLWGLADKLAAIAGVLVFGALGMETGLFVLAGFFAGGLVLLVLLVDERKGLEAARRAEAEHTDRAIPPTLGR